MECIDGTQAHHWDIETSKGSMSNGTCRKCGRISTFQNYVSIVSAWKEASEKGFKAKHSITLGREKEDGK